MELATLAQGCADAYREIGEGHAWRKSRNSPRGYDALTIPLDTWDDGPHRRFLLNVDHHLATGALHLDAAAACLRAQNTPATVTLARAVFVESSKACWLLDDEVHWTQRAARAHLELYANLDARMRALPKRVESGYPNFRRRQWKESRDQMRDRVIATLFGKRELTGKRDDLTLIGEPLLTNCDLEADFAARLGERSDTLADPCVAAPQLFIDPAVEVVASDGAPIVVHGDTAAHAVSIALAAWLYALEQWVEYHAWDTGPVAKLGQRLAALPVPPM